MGCTSSGYDDSVCMLVNEYLDENKRQRAALCYNVAEQDIVEIRMADETKINKRKKRMVIVVDADNDRFEYMESYHLRKARDELEDDWKTITIAIVHDTDSSKDNLMRLETFQELRAGVKAVEYVDESGRRTPDETPDKTAGNLLGGSNFSKKRFILTHHDLEEICRLITDPKGCSNFFSIYLARVLPG